MPTKSVLTKNIEEMIRLLGMLNNDILALPDMEYITETPEVRCVHTGAMCKTNYTAYVERNASLDIRITTHARTHFFVTIYTKDLARYYTYEDANVINGTNMFIYNLDRSVQRVPLVEFAHTPTVITLTGATVLSNGILIRGEFTTKNEFAIMRPDTTYLFRITNITQQQNIISFVAQFYEE